MPVAKTYSTRAEAVAAGCSNPYPLDRDTWIASSDATAGCGHIAARAAARNARTEAALKAAGGNKQAALAALLAPVAPAVVKKAA